MTREDDELADRAERGTLRSKPGAARRGRTAAEHGRRLLMEATGAGTVEEATRRAIGRPSLTPGVEGSAPVLQARVTNKLFDEVDKVASDRHVPKSVIVREALEQYLVSN